MFVMDVPDVTPLHSPMVIAQASQKSAKIDRTIGICHLLQNPPIPPDTAVNVISPARSVNLYFDRKERRWVGLSGKVTVLEGPKHGKLEAISDGAYSFVPVPDYYGADRATLLVEIGGLKVKAIYFFNVKDVVGGNDAYDPYMQHCPKGRYWKISLKPGEITGGLNFLLL
jgi:hypothetical protein